MAVIISVVAAGRGRGKTSLIEFLCRSLSENLQIWTVKHVSKHFDTVEKDTWRHLDAGAQGTIATGPEQLVILKPQSQATLKKALGEVPDDVDLILVEGFRKSNYPKILIAQSQTEAEEQLDKISEIIAISGPIADTGIAQSIRGVPVHSSESILETIKHMVQENQVKRLPGIDCGKCGYSSCEAMASAILKGEASLRNCLTLQISDITLTVNGSQIPLSKFPRAIIKNVILSLVASLKGLDTERTRRIIIRVRD